MFSTTDGLNLLRVASYFPTKIHPWEVNLQKTIFGEISEKFQKVQDSPGDLDFSGRTYTPQNVDGESLQKFFPET